jgi:hypothetical protein
MGQKGRTMRIELIGNDDLPLDDMEYRVQVKTGGNGSLVGTVIYSPGRTGFIKELRVQAQRVEIGMFVLRDEKFAIVFAYHPHAKLDISTYFLHHGERLVFDPTSDLQVGGYKAHLLGRSGGFLVLDVDKLGLAVYSIDEGLAYTVHRTHSSIQGPLTSTG